MDKRFILWNEKDGEPCRDNGRITSSGAVGEIPIDSVYLTSYGWRPAGAPTYDELQVGQCIPGVSFHVSMTKGTYTVYRVQ